MEKRADTRFAQIPSTLIAAIRATSAPCSLALKLSCVQGLEEMLMPSSAPVQFGFFAHIGRTAEEALRWNHFWNNCKVKPRRAYIGRHSRMLARQVVVSDRLFTLVLIWCRVLGRFQRTWNLRSA